MKLTKAAQRILGALIAVADQTVAEVIRARGGSAANVRETGPWAQRTIAEAALAVLEGDMTAAKAIKIVKQARRLGRKYGGNSS